MPAGRHRTGAGLRVAAVGVVAEHHRAVLDDPASSKDSKKGKKTGVVAPKYRDPADADNQWTGRGKPPRWMAAYLAKGRKKEEFLI